MGGAIARDIAAHLPPGSMHGVVYIGTPPTWRSQRPLVLRPALLPFMTLSLEDAAALDFAVAFNRLCVSRDTDATTSFYEDTIKLNEDGADFVPENPAATYVIRSALIGMTATMKPIYRRCASAQHTSGDESKLLQRFSGGIPVLLIVGSRDAFFDCNKLVDAYKPAVKNLEVHIVEGASHATFIDAPDEVMSTISKFSRKVHSMS